MIIIMDDVVDNITTLQEFAQHNNKNRTEKWYSLKDDHLFVDFCKKMIEIASNPFDLSSCSQKSTKYITYHIIDLGRVAKMFMVIG